ncbi:hypothetical protein [Virgibacillus alimentarius]|uniref:hypothetical protein n=1 Tax=Virgibacillus alimentarius TaxID=698769 RepID=UPI0004934126|nr:hypothetical protein [Virgibacillus alimentarius]
MFVGVISSFLLIFLFPNNFYDMPAVPNLVYLKKIFTTSWTIEKVMTAVSLFLFVVSTTIFITSLVNFVNSFDIRKTIEKNYKNIMRLSALKKIKKLDNLTKKDNLLLVENIEEIKMLTNDAYSTPLGTREMNQLSKDIDIFIDNLCYLMTLNHKEYIDKFVNDWSKISGNIQSIIYHSNEITDRHEKIYIQTLGGTLKIIDKVADNINLKYYFNKLLNILIVSLPMLKEDLDDEFKNQYTKNYGRLAFLYYKELLKGIEFLYFNTSHKEILNTLLHDESFNSIVIENNYFLRNRANLDIKEEMYSEYFLLSLLYKYVTENITTELPIIIALLTKNQAIKEDSSYKERTRRTARDIEKMFKSVSDKESNNLDLDKTWKTQKNSSLKFSDELLSSIVIIIVKACELENYKAAGYLVKRVSNSSEYEQIKRVIKKLGNSIYDSKERHLLATDITLNDYSLKYCLNKAIFLLMLQFGYEKNLKVNFDKWISDEFKNNIVDSFKDKHKEYNLYCIHYEYLKKVNLVS